VIAWLRNIVENPNTERMVMALIIINATVLGLETSQEVMATSGHILELIDHVLLAIFVAELAARIIVHRLDFFRDPWSVFDFVVIGIALVPATENFTVLRALRILRVLRLITAIPTLKRVVAGLLASLPGMGSILFLIGLIYYMFSVMGTKLFGATNPELFGTLGKSLYTLFTVMTLEGWTNDVAKPVLEHHPYGWIYIFAFIIVATFMVLNLFIGVVVNAMQAEAVKAEEAERVIVHEEAAPILAEVKRRIASAVVPAARGRQQPKQLLRREFVAAHAPEQANHRYVHARECGQHRNRRVGSIALEQQRTECRRERLCDQARKRQSADQDRIAPRTEQCEWQRSARDPGNAVAGAIEENGDCKDGRRDHQQQQSYEHERAGRDHGPDRMIALPEHALQHARANLRRPKQRPECHRHGELDAPRLQKDQQVHHHD
jgi:voltage-gated sodium channel